MKKFKNVLWGLFFLLAAGFILISQLGIITTGIAVWKLILAVCLLAITIEGIIHVEFFSILMPIAGILCLFAEPLGLQALSPWPLLGAAALASTGLWIIFGKFASKFHKRDHSEWAHHVESTEDVNENSFKTEVGFGASIKYLHSQNLEYAKIECAFGSLKVYFDQAQLSPNGADVYAQVGFGNMVLYVPKHWHVTDAIQAHVGAVKNRGNQAEVGAPQLRLTGDVAFGALEIVYV